MAYLFVNAVNLINFAEKLLQKKGKNKTRQSSCWCWSYKLLVFPSLFPPKPRSVKLLFRPNCLFRGLYTYSSVCVVVTNTCNSLYFQDHYTTTHTLPFPFRVQNLTNFLSLKCLHQNFGKPFLVYNFKEMSNTISNEFQAKIAVIVLRPDICAAWFFFLFF